MTSTRIWTEQTVSLIYMRLSPNIARHKIQFQIGDCLPIEVLTDAPPHWNSSINHIKYKFDQTDREVFSRNR